MSTGYLNRPMWIVGYNDTPLGSSLPVPLTTVRSPILDIGHAAFTLLEATISGGSPSSVILEPELSRAARRVP